jgi:3-oxoacyl-[acyl-carrier protein] reductase
MDLELSGKVVMVAAASKGMGRACAFGFAREGARVSICARNVDELRRTSREIVDQTGAEVLAVPTDLSVASATQAWVDWTIERFGGVDILVSNVGGPPLGRFEHFQTDQAWKQAFESVLLSTVRLIRAVVPSMRERGGGRILSIQSSSVKQPIEMNILSNAIRPGVAGLYKTLSRELAADNILVNVVAPGRIYTDRLKSGLVRRAEDRGIPLEEEVRNRTADIPLQRFGTPEEFADVVLFLASARASYITGSTLAVDGGLIQSLW